MNHEEFPNPNQTCVDYWRGVQMRAMQEVEREIAKYLRNQTIINDIKRQCGVSTSEGK